MLASLNCRVRTPELMIMFWCFALTDFLPLPLQQKVSSHYELIKTFYVYVYICEIVCVGGGGKWMLCREERKRYKTHQNQITTKKKNKNICFLPPRVEMPTIKKKSYKHCKRGSTYPMIYQMRGKKKEHKNVMHSYYRL